MYYQTRLQPRVPGRGSPVAWAVVAVPLRRQLLWNLPG